MNLIRSYKLDVRYGSSQVLREIDFSMDRGEIVTIVGPNGSGKSTFLRVLIGAQRPTKGRVKRAPSLRIGYVPQRLSIDYTMPMTVIRFLALSGNTDRTQITNLLQRVGITERADRQMINLSGGEFQRVLLTQALLRNPDILVLDEPTQGLDPPAVAAFYRLIEEFRQELGCAVLIVSHDLHVVMGTSDRVICLNGHICCEGTPTAVSASPAYRALFDLDTEDAVALYRHHHDHLHHSNPPHELR